MMSSFFRSLCVLFIAPSLLGSSDTTALGEGRVSLSGVELSRQRVTEQFYFAHEIDFLARQSMILGGYQPSNGGDDDRLRFVEKSLKLELEYVRTLKAMLENADEVVPDVNDRDPPSLPNEDSVDEIETRNNKEKGVCPEVLSNTIGEATFPSWAYPISSSTTDAPPRPQERHEITSLKADHEFDFDWMLANGFGGMHDELNCRDHAHDQGKPIYTPEMWDALRRAYRDSTLFPFPLPTASERSSDEPFRVEYTTDGKGRGNFASRNISKGELVHGGHPYTVFFLDAQSFYRFVSSLPKMHACDVLEWAWQQDLTDSGNVVLCLNVDAAVFFNDGGWADETNIEMKETTSLDFYAMEDIPEGTELMYDYDHFVFDTDEMDL